MDKISVLGRTNRKLYQMKFSKTGIKVKKKRGQIRNPGYRDVS